MLETLLDALLDTAKTIPFLFAAYIIIGIVETKLSTKMQLRLSHMGPLGPLGGALFGIVPQCGFSVAAANFYARKMISMGTLIAVFLSTSDEFIPIVLANPQAINSLWKMILCKLVIAIVSGIGVDAVLSVISRSYAKKHIREEIKSDHIDVHHHSHEHAHSHGKDEQCNEDCHGHKHRGIILDAVIKTIQIGLFILAVNIVLGFAIYFIGEDTISKVMLNGTVFQPFLTALIGFIPNCAASVVISELFIEGAMSFGSCVAGLCTGAGVGLAVLFRSNRNWKQNFLIIGIIYVISVGCGLLIDLIIP